MAHSSSSTASPTPATWASSCEQPKPPDAKASFSPADQSKSITPKSCAPPWAPSFACPPSPPGRTRPVTPASPAQHPDHRSTYQRHLLPQSPNPKPRCPPPRQRSLWHRSRPPRPIRSHRHHPHGRPGRIAQHRSRKRHPPLSNSTHRDGTGACPVVILYGGRPLRLDAIIACRGDPLWSPVAVPRARPSDGIKKTHPLSSRVGLCDPHRPINQTPTA